MNPYTLAGFEDELEKIATTPGGIRKAVADSAGRIGRAGGESGAARLDRFVSRNIAKRDALSHTRPGASMRRSEAVEEAAHARGRMPVKLDQPFTWSDEHAKTVMKKQSKVMTGEQMVNVGKVLKKTHPTSRPYDAVKHILKSKPTTPGRTPWNEVGAAETQMRIGREKVQRMYRPGGAKSPHQEPSLLRQVLTGEREGGEIR